MTAQISTVAEVRARAEHARRRGVEFLLEHIGSDGSVADATGGRVTWYRFPWALEVSGETAAAAAVLGWIERTGLGTDGQFHGGITWDSGANRTTNTYPETILAYGAWLMRRVALPSSGLYPVAVLALTVLAYAGMAAVHASGFAAVYTAALVLGNSELPHRQVTRSFSEGVAWLPSALP